MPGYQGCDYPVLGRDKVCFVGQPVAAVVARSRYEAEDGADAIIAEYDPLPPVLDIDRASEPGSATIHPSVPDNLFNHFTLAEGDLEGAFAHADHLVELEIRNGPLRPGAAGKPYRHRRVGRTLWRAGGDGIASGAAPLSDRPCGIPRARRVAHSRRLAGCGGRVRRQADGLPGGSGDLRAVASGRKTRLLDLRPARRPADNDAGPRAGSPHQGGRRQRRAGARRSGDDQGQQRCVSDLADVGRSGFGPSVGERDGTLRHPRTTSEMSTPLPRTRRRWVLTAGSGGLPRVLPSSA